MTIGLDANNQKIMEKTHKMVKINSLLKSEPESESRLGHSRVSDTGFGNSSIKGALPKDLMQRGTGAGSII